jgi:hypothetical protein
VFPSQACTVSLGIDLNVPAVDFQPC